MGHLPIWSLTPSKAPQPWARRRARRWVRSGDIASADMFLAAIPSLPRAELARLTERLIDRMDELDGDADLEATGEDDEPEDDVDDARDDGCGPVHKHGLTFWGSQGDEPGHYTPIYGIDQTAGPVNQRDVRRAHQE